MPYRRFFEDVCQGVEPGSGDWMKAWCPLHEDPRSSKTKSFSYNPKTGGWNCFSRCGTGHASQLFGMLSDPTYNGDDPDHRRDASREFNEKYPETKVAEYIEPKRKSNPDPKRLPPESKVDRYHQNLLQAEKQLEYLLEERAISRGVIEEMKIGWDGQRYTIPIYNQGQLLAFRYYNPTNTDFHVEKLHKFQGTKGDEVQFFPGSIQGGEEIYLVEGEPDCMALRSLGYNAYTLTGGAGTFPASKAMALLGFSKIIIVYDSDEPGRKGSAKVAKTLRDLHFDAIKNVDLRQLPGATEKEDITDLIKRLGDQFQQRFEEVVGNAPWCGRTDSGDDIAQPNVVNKSKIIPVDFQKAIQTQYRDKKIEMEITVLSVAPVPVECEISYDLECRSRQRGAKKECADCPLAYRAISFDAVNNAQDVVDGMIGQPIRKRDIKNRHGIGCLAFDKDVTEYGHYHNALIAPKSPRDSDFRKSTTMTRESYIRVPEKGGPPDQNAVYKVVSEQFKHPKTNEVGHLIDSFTKTKRSVEEFDITDNFHDVRKLFSCDQSDPVSVSRKLDEIYDDFEDHVIGHAVNRNLLFGLDMTFHSVAEFELPNKPVPKGMIEMLLIGDTRIGKTHSSKMLIEHFRRGDLYSVDNASEAGLFGGVDEAGASKRRFVKCGVIPLSHKELVVLDEANELTKEMVGRLSGVRSEGIYQVMKIASADIPCRLRMIWIANPRTSRAVSDYAFGVETIPEVIGKPEDIARFDTAFVMSKRDIDLEQIHKKPKPKGAQKFTTEACSMMVDWAWSRVGNQIVLTEGTFTEILELSRKMARDYSDKIPLVNDTEQRMKVARFSIALAARLGSTDDTGERILVYPAHVKIAVERLRAMFDAPSMAYDRYSFEKTAAALGEEARQAVNALGRKYANIVRKSNISKNFFKDICGKPEDGQKIWTYLLRGDGIDNRGRRPYLTSALLDYLNRYINDKANPEGMDVDGRLDDPAPNCGDIPAGVDEDFEEGLPF